MRKKHIDFSLMKNFEVLALLFLETSLWTTSENVVWKPHILYFPTSGIFRLVCGWNRWKYIFLIISSRELVSNRKCDIFGRKVRCWGNAKPSWPILDPLPPSCPYRELRKGRPACLFVRANVQFAYEIPINSSSPTFLVWRLFLQMSFIFGPLGHYLITALTMMADSRFKQREKTKHFSSKFFWDQVLISK